MCGDGQVTGDELCDADTVTCASLGTMYASGMATCRSTCLGYDVSTCVIDSTVAAEQVRPAARDPRWNDAVCNDGTSYAFSVSLPATPSNEWVIFLEGGGFCDGSPFNSCLPPHQPTKLTSSAAAPADRAKLTATGGSTLLNRNGDAAKNPRFHGANLVFATYCSSDLWTGTRAEPFMLEGVSRQFTGKLNVKAMLEILRQRYGLDDSRSDTKVLYTGASAGGNGARNTVDLVVKQLPNTAAGQRIWLAPENGFMPMGWTWTDPTFSILGSDLPDLQYFENDAQLWHSQISAACTTLALTAGQLPSVCATGKWGDWAALKPLAEGGLGLRVFEYQSRRDTVYATDMHKLTTAAQLAPWDVIVAKEIDESGVRWYFTPDAQIHGLQGQNASGLFNYHHVPFPAYDAANSPSCNRSGSLGSTPYATGKDYYSMVVDFFDDPAPATSGERVCFDVEGAGHQWP